MPPETCNTPGRLLRCPCKSPFTPTRDTGDESRGKGFGGRKGEVGERVGKNEGIYKRTLLCSRRFYNYNCPSWERTTRVSNFLFVSSTLRMGSVCKLTIYRSITVVPFRLRSLYPLLSSLPGPTRSTGMRVGFTLGSGPGRWGRTSWKKGVRGVYVSFPVLLRGSNPHNPSLPTTRTQYF